MARPNRRQQQKEQTRRINEENRIRNEVNAQQTIGVDVNNPLHGPKAPDNVDHILNKYYNNSGPDFNSMSYSVDDSVYNMSWADVNKQKINLTAEDFGVDKELTFLMSEDEELNDFIHRSLKGGDTYEDIRAKINRGFENKDLSEEQFRLGKKTIKENEEYIRSYVANKQTASEATEQVIKNVTEEAVSEGAEDVGNQYLKRALSGRNLNALMNLGFAVSDYHEARNAGEGVLKSGAKAGALFVAGEMLGGWMMPVMLAKQLPTLAVSAVETTQNITRKMNSTARIQTFGEAQFQDTQQLATMRQAGMELAKMSQYNLQQSIMGNEAQYMHRL